MSISINKNKKEGNFIEAEKSANNTRDKKRTRKKRDGVDGLESSTKEKDKVAEERDGNSGDPKKREEKKQEREDNATEAEKGANNTNDKKRKRKKSYKANGLESTRKGNDKISKEKEGLSGDPKKRKKKQEREDNSPEAEKGANTTNDKKRKRKKSYEANGLESSRKGNDKISKEKEGLSGDPKKRKKKQEREDNSPEAEKAANNTNDKRKKRKKSDEANCLESSPKGNDKVAKEKEGLSGDPNTSRPKRKARRVSFSGNVEVFPPTEKNIDVEKYVEQGLVHGKRFSLEEDELVKEAVFNYIKENQLGDDGLDMVLNCSKHRQIRNCWKKISASLPWRPVEAVYSRAHALFERSEKREWDPEEFIIIRSLYEKHGPRWKEMAKVLGKHRRHVKDAWRRIALPNLRKGHWSQDEYQTLFDLVNLDLKMKAFEEKDTKHGMLRDNIAWGAVSMKLSTRMMSQCCIKWYDQLCSPMVSQGLWMNSDDYRMLDALFKLDACCVEDVDWDNLLEHRLGETCRLRWKEMTRQLGEYREKPFVEQLDMLSKRYVPEMFEYRELYEK